MSRKNKSATDRKMDEDIQQFCSVTGTSARDARRYIEAYTRVDIAIDAFYNQPLAAAPRHGGASASVSKLNQLFDSYKDPDGDDITVDGTIRFCADLEVDPEDVVLLAIAYELKSPHLGEWSRKEWVDGWKSLGCDNIPAMKAEIPKLREKLGSNTDYFRKVYNYTFEFARPPGQRSLALELAQGFWALLIPHGLAGGALAHVHSVDDDDEDEDMDEDDDEGEGWSEKHTQLWFQFLSEKGGKGISKDVWQMFLEFVRTIDSKFEKYDTEAAWPSTLDEFVDYGRQHLGSS